MPLAKLTKPKRKLTNCEFDRETLRRLTRIKRVHGITKTAALSRGLCLLEQDLMAQRPALNRN